MVGIGVLRIESDELLQVLYRPSVLAKVEVRNTPVVVGDGVLRVEADRLCVVLYRKLVLTIDMVQFATVVESISSL